MSTIDAPPTDVAKPVAANGYKFEVDRLFEALVKLSGSDLHLKADQPPIIRVKGSLTPLKHPKIDDARMRQLCRLLALSTPWPEPIGLPAGITLAAPRPLSRLAITGSSLV